MVPHPAPADHSHLHGHLRQHRRPPHRRSAPVPLLPFRHCHLELFRQLPHQNLRNLHRQRQYLRQGLFPPPGDAHLGAPLQPDHLRHPVRAVPRLPGLFHRHGLRRAGHLVGRPAARFAAPHGRPRAGLRHHHLFPDHQIPRPALPGDLRRPAVDVRHPDHLPGFLHPRALPEADPPQPHHPGGRGLPLCLPGHRRLQLGHAGLQLRLHDRRRPYRHHHL